VTARISGEDVNLSGIGGGVYEGSIRTSDLSVGVHVVELVAEKEGFEPGSGSESVTVETPTMILSLNLDESIRKGSRLTIDTEVRDVSDNPVEGVEVTATVGDVELELSEVGEGLYRVRLETKELEVGTYSVAVSAIKEGYESASTRETIEVVQGGGIPGFPNDSVFLGIILGIVALWLISQSTALRARLWRD
jgi:hypothetical protein